MELKGLYLNNIETAPSLSTWKDAVNILVDSSGMAITHETGFLFNVELEGNPVSAFYTPRGIVIFTEKDGDSYIYLHKGGNDCNLVVKDRCFNFRQNRLWDLAYVINGEGNLIIAFTDGVETPKIINIDKSDPNIELYGELAQKYELFPRISTPTLENISVIIGGRLLVGTYVITILGIDETHTSYNWSQLSPTINIDIPEIHTTKPIADNGSIENQRTNKALNLQIFINSGLIKFFKIGIILNNNKVVKCFVSKEYIVATSVSYINIVDTDDMDTASISDFINPKAIYKTVANMATSTITKKLYLSGLTTYNSFNYQPFANDIKIEWDLNKVVAINYYTTAEINYKFGSALIYDKGFIPGSVMAFYIALILKGGGIYGVYHIPGREANIGDKDLIIKPTNINNRDSDDCLLDKEVMLYQVRDTFSVSNKSNSFGYGEMSYWENRDENYTPDFPDSYSGRILKNTPVRHHKFPSSAGLMKEGFKYIQYIDDLHADTIPPLNLLSISATTIAGSVIAVTTSPQSSTYKAKIDHKYEINIEYSNTDIILQPGEYYSETINIYFKRLTGAGGTIEKITFTLLDIYEYNSTGNPITINRNCGYTYVGDIYSDESIMITNYNTGAITAETLDVLSLLTEYSHMDSFTTPLGIRVSNIKLPRELEGIVEGFQILYASPDLIDSNFIANTFAKQIGTDTYGLNLETHPIDVMATNLNSRPIYYNLEGTITTIVGTGGLQQLVVTPIESRYGAGAETKPGMLCSIKNAYIAPALNSILENDINDYYRIISNEPKRYVENEKYLCTIWMYRRNTYLDYVNKKLVSTGRVFPLAYKEGFSEKYIINGGHAVMTQHRYLRYSSNDTILEVNFETVWSTFNSYFRTKGESSIQDPWYNKQAPAPDFDQYKEQGNYYKFRSDTQLSTKYLEHEIYSPYRENITTIKNMIAESEAFDTSGVTMNWRKFNPLSTYILPSLKGDIVALRISGKLMYISCEKALFAASIKDVLQTESGNAFLTKGDFFDRPPTEVVPSDMGTIGNSSKDATQITTEGLITVDRETGSIYIVGDSIKEITTASVKDGIKQLICPNIYGIINSNDEPYIDEPSRRGGVSIVDDPYYKRLMITMNSSNWELLPPSKTQTIEGVLYIGVCKISCKYYPELQLSNRKHFIIVFNDNGVITEVNVFSMKNNGNISESICYDGKYNDRRDKDLLAESIKNAINNFLLATGRDENYQCYGSGGEVIIRPISKDFECYVKQVLINDTINTLFIPTMIIDKKINTFSYSYGQGYFVSRHIYFNTNYTIHASRSGIFLLESTNTKTNLYTTSYENNPGFIHKSFVDFIFNIGGSNPARLQNVAFNATYSIESSVFNPANTYGVTSIALYTLNQCSGDIELTPNNIKQLHGFYYFNDIYDKLITQNIPFIIDGEFNKDILDGNEVSELIPDMLYITSDLNNGDYIQYNGKTYNMNGVVFKAVSGNTTFIASGSATVKTYKPWQTVSKIFSKVFVVRFTLANEGSGINTITNVNINFKPTRTTYAEIKNSGN